MASRLWGQRTFLLCFKCGGVTVRESTLREAGEPELVQALRAVSKLGRRQSERTCHHCGDRQKEMPIREAWQRLPTAEAAQVEALLETLPSGFESLSCSSCLSFWFSAEAWVRVTSQTSLEPGRIKEVRVGTEGSAAEAKAGAHPLGVGALVDLPVLEATKTPRVFPFGSVSLCAVIFAAGLFTNHSPRFHEWAAHLSEGGLGAWLAHPVFADRTLASLLIGNQSIDFWMLLLFGTQLEQHYPARVVPLLYLAGAIGGTVAAQALGSELSQGLTGVAAAFALFYALEFPWQRIRMKFGGRELGLPVEAEGSIPAILWVLVWAGGHATTLLVQGADFRNALLLDEVGKPLVVQTARDFVAPLLGGIVGGLAVYLTQLGWMPERALPQRRKTDRP